MKSFVSFVCLLIVLVVCSGAEAKNKVEGSLKGPFGNTIAYNGQESGRQTPQNPTAIAPPVFEEDESVEFETSQILLMVAAGAASLGLGALYKARQKARSGDEMDGIVN